MKEGGWCRALPFRVKFDLYCPHHITSNRWAGYIHSSSTSQNHLHLTRIIPNPPEPPPTPQDNPQITRTTINTLVLPQALCPQICFAHWATGNESPFARGASDSDEGSKYSWSKEMVPSNLSILPPRGCSGCTPQAAGWWENIQDTARTEGSFHWLLKLSLHFYPPTRKSQPLLETSCVMQRNIPTKPCLRQLGPPPSPSPKLCAPHLASTFPALPSAKRGICFSLPQPTSGRGGEPAVSLGRAGSTRDPCPPPAFPDSSSIFCQWFSGVFRQLPFGECPPWGAGGLGGL